MNNETKEFYAAVEDMRSAQKMFFASVQPELRKRLLKESKEAEAKVDKMLKSYREGSLF